MAQEEMARIFAMPQLHGANGPTIQTSTSVACMTSSSSQHQLEAVSSTTTVVRSSGPGATTQAPAAVTLAARLDAIFTDILSRFGLPEYVPEEVKTEASSTNGLSDAESSTPTTSTSDQGFDGEGEIGTPTGDSAEPVIAEPAERMFFAVEQAYWFYCDFFHDRDTSLPEFCLSEFATEVFRRCPSLLRNGETPRAVYERFMAYKARIPKCGAVLLTSKMDKVALVQPWNRNVWQFPRGKLGDNESERDAALREVYEETGYDARDTMTNTYLKLQCKASATLYFVVGVPEDYKFEPQTRKEVRSVNWFEIAELLRNCEARSTDAAAKLFLKSFGSVLPYLRPMARWINQERARHGIPCTPIQVSSIEDPVSVQEAPRRMPPQGNNVASPAQQQKQPQQLQTNKPQPKQTSQPTTPQGQQPNKAPFPPKSPSKPAIVHQQQQATQSLPSTNSSSSTNNNVNNKNNTSSTNNASVNSLIRQTGAASSVMPSASAPARDTAGGSAGSVPHAHTVSGESRLDFAAVFQKQFNLCLSESAIPAPRPLQRSATASTASVASAFQARHNTAQGIGATTASVGGMEGAGVRRGMSWGVQPSRMQGTPLTPEGSPIPTFGGIPWADEGVGVGAGGLGQVSGAGEDGGSRRGLAQFTFDASSLLKALE